MSGATTPPPTPVVVNTDDRVLITGCGGMLGDAMYHTFSRTYRHVRATDIALNEPWLSHLDVRELGECERAFADLRPTIVLHLAALTDLEYCETHQDDCWKTNALGAENVALLARRYDATMVYISTAGIYAGEKAEYHDFDLPNPLSHYGRAKYHGERVVEMRVPKYFCLRAGWMMGGGPTKDKKFINKIFQQIKAGARELRVVDDRFGTPTYTVDFARSIVVGIFLGSRPSAGYSVEIAEITRDGKALVVTYRERRPGPNDMAAQMMTAPFQLAAIDRFPGEIRFVRAR